MPSNRLNGGGNGGEQPIGNPFIGGGNMEGLARAMANRDREANIRQETLKAFFTEEPLLIDGKDFDVGQVGWEGANETLPMVLISKKKRAELGINSGEYVIVKTATGDTIPCIAERQFRALLDKCTLNYHASHILKARSGAKVTIYKLEPVLPITPNNPQGVE